MAKEYYARSMRKTDLTCELSIKDQLHTLPMKRLIENYVDAYCDCVHKGAIAGEYYRSYAIIVADDALMAVTSLEDKELYSLLREYQLMKARTKEWSYIRKCDALQDAAEDIVCLIIDKYYPDLEY